MSARVSWTTLALALCLGVSAGAHEEEAFEPPNADVDRDLDEALEEEYSEPARPDPPSMARPRAPDYAATVQREEARDRRVRVRLRMMAAYTHSLLSDVKLSKRHNGQGGDLVSFADSDTDADGNRFDFEGSGGGLYDVGLHLGKWVVLRIGARHAAFEETQQLTGFEGGTPGFDFGGTSFATGSDLTAKFSFTTVDYDTVVRPLNNDWVTLDVSLGGRYLRWETEFSGPSGIEDDVFEAWVPMIGLGLTLRPVRELGFFFKVRTGHISLEYDREDDDSVVVTDADTIEREHTALEVDVGLSLVFEDSFGFVAGYRGDYTELERTKGDDRKTLEASVHGAYAGFVIQF